MGPTARAAALAVLLAGLAGPCYALWGIATVSKAEAKKLGLEVSFSPAGPSQFRVELAFKPEKEFKKYSRVDLLVGGGDDALTAALKETRTKDGRVVVDFAATRSQIDRSRLRVMIPGGAGGSIYEIRLKVGQSPV